MNKRTHFFIKIYLSHFILKRVDVSVLCESWLERHILKERTSSHIFFQEPGGANTCTPCKLVRDASGWPHVPHLTMILFLCLNLNMWFSSRDLLVTHLFDLSALIVLSCLQIKMWQLAKHTGSLGTNHGICYITHYTTRTPTSSIAM